MINLLPNTLQVNNYRFSQLAIVEESNEVMFDLYHPCNAFAILTWMYW